MPAGKHQHGYHGHAAILQPGHALQSHLAQGDVDDAVIGVEHPQEDHAAGGHGDVAGHEDDGAHHAVGLGELFV